MPVAIDVRDAVVPRAAVAEAFAWLEWVDATFSTYRADSEIARLNRGELTLGGCDPRVAEVLAACDALRERTGGAFDAAAAAAMPGARERPGCGGHPGAVEPAGYVKGWAAARAWDILAAAGVRNALVDAAGDMVVRGRPAPGERWRIGIEHPLERDAVAAVLELTDLCVATSGTARRGEHIVVPATGAPPAGVLAVTCVGRDLAVTDALATAAFAMGPASAEWLAVQPDVEAMVVLADGTVRLTPGFDALRVS
ncbi:FAD:protein FMN transferase [Paraconexibacter antarcticus]|uniref:FAD:protein FMN transferase n=1 Tax=Paraconexibacter antarcticus TaxID=2949664 RepID=A0ABY5DYW4_9ACTN|nr:FAD:protein FMN transferase [Paraconexibacter antarcticus]UTI66062.1 FAD:protein FMN transferase [Paraconexibacter antarcticus]